MVKFHLLTRKDRKLINGFLTLFPPDLSEFTFTNLFAWRHVRPIWHLQLEDSLIFCIAGPEGQKKKIILGAPIGHLSLCEALDILQEQVMGAIRIPEYEARLLQAHHTQVFEDRDNYDYVYQVSDLAQLSGRNYAKKRNLVKQCLEGYSCHYEAISEDNKAECKAMLLRWCRLRNCTDDPGLCGEFQAINDVLDNFMEFGLLGGAVRVDGIIEAFAIGEPLNRQTAVWHFEKAMPHVKGLGQLVNNWFAKYHLQGFTFVNREQDLGIPGLRQAKESYYPDHLVPKYTTMVSPPKSGITGCD